MKKFVLLHYGFEKPTPEIMAAWGKWFEATKPHTVDMGGFGNGREISKGGTKDLPLGPELHYRLYDRQRGKSRRCGEDGAGQPVHFEHSSLRSKVGLTFSLPSLCHLRGECKNGPGECRSRFQH